MKSFPVKTSDISPLVRFKDRVYSAHASTDRDREGRVAVENIVGFLKRARVINWFYPITAKEMHIYINRRKYDSPTK